MGNIGNCKGIGAKPAQNGLKMTPEIRIFVSGSGGGQRYAKSYSR
jgi:hypothetical protein